MVSESSDADMTTRQSEATKESSDDDDDHDHTGTDRKTQTRINILGSYLVNLTNNNQIPALQQELKLLIERLSKKTAMETRHGLIRPMSLPKRREMMCRQPGSLSRLYLSFREG